MTKKDIFSEDTFISGEDEEIIIQKNASIYGKGIPRLEAHGKSKKLSNKAVGMGRDKHNAIIISDPRVSKFHAVMTFKKGIGYIRDTNSSNGTYINGEKITTNKDIRLNNKDKIFLGKTEITYYC